MTSSSAINRRFALLAFALFWGFAYQTERMSGVITGRFSWIPHVAAAPLWFRLGFHAVFAAMVGLLCAFCSWRAITSIRLDISTHLTAAKARQAVVGSRLAPHLPPATDGAYNIRLNQLNDWRCWTTGTGLFLMTLLPYWALLLVVGHGVAFGPLYAAIQIGHRLPWQFSAAAVTTILAARLLLRYLSAGPRIRGADKAAMTIIAFAAGSERWTGWQLWLASVIYSFWLQTRGFFPFLTLLTAVPSQRIMLALYCRRVDSGDTQEDALSYIFTVRVTRVIAACGFYTMVLAIRLWPVIWK